MDKDYWEDSEIPIRSSISCRSTVSMLLEVCKALVDLDPLLHNVSNIQGYADTLQDIVERFKDAWNVNDFKV